MTCRASPVFLVITMAGWHDRLISTHKYSGTLPPMQYPSPINASQTPSIQRKFQKVGQEEGD
jgi:hypothetical protein